MSTSSMPYKSKKRSKISSKNKYLKPGALAQIRYSRTATRSCKVIGKKRILLDSEKENQISSNDIGTPITSPVLKLPKTPKTPQDHDFDSDSRLESLPLDILVKIMCHLHHDQLSPVFHVSQRIRAAVITARNIHFNYTTPDRSRQEMLKIQTPLPTEHWPFFRGKGLLVPSLLTPKAPRHGPRPPRPHFIDVKQIAAALFHEPSVNRSGPPGLPKPVFKAVGSNRVLFCEDELCQAVAQNKLM